MLVQLIQAAVLVLAPIVAAHAQAPETTQETARPAPSQRFVWTGVTLGANGARFTRPPIIVSTSTSYGEGSKAVVTRANPRATAEEHLRELATLRLSIEVDRKLDDALAKLDDLHVRAAWKEDYVGRFEVLQELVLTRSMLFEKRGHKDAALAALAQLLPDARLSASFASKYVFEPANEAQLGFERAALAADPITSATARLSGRGGGEQKQGSDRGDSAIEANVLKWIAAGSNHAVFELGSRAAPALEKLVESAYEEMHSNAQLDALTLLFHVEEARGARFALEHFDKGGFLWKKRILRAMQNAAVLIDDDTWLVGSDQARRPTLIDQGWVPLVERLAADADVRNEALRTVVQVFCIQDALTPAMQSELSRAIASQDPATRQAAMNALQHSYRRSTALSVLEGAVQHPDEAVRRYAAELLFDEPRSPALLARATDSDVDVRRIVVQSLRERQSRRALFAANGGAVLGRGDTRPEIGAQERTAITTLLRDEDAGIRKDALKIALRLELPLDEDAFLPITKDPDPELRAELAGNLRARHPNVLSILTALASDGDTTVKRALDFNLDAMCSNGQTEMLLPVVLLRLAAKEPPTYENLNVQNGSPTLDIAIRNALRYETGLPRVLEIASTPGHEWLVPHVLSSFPWPRSGERPEGLSTLRALDSARFAAFLRVAARLHPTWIPAFADGASRAALEGHLLRDAWLGLLEDSALDRTVRAFAAKVVASTADERVENALVKFLQDDTWKTKPVETLERDALSEIGKRFTAERRPHFFRGLIQDRRTADEPLRWIVGNARKDGLAVAALERWLGETSLDGFESLLTESIVALPAQDDPKTVELLRRGLRDPRTDQWTTTALGRFRSPFALELLTDALDASWISERDRRSGVQQSAARSLTGYMSEAAAQSLLAGVTQAVSADARKACLDGVEQIRLYLDEKQRWELRETDLEKRATAVKEVLALLADADANTRAQAAKSLATLDAVEHLPRLIGLLKDKSAEVRAAAQAAIDQLNAKSAKKE